MMCILACSHKYDKTVDHVDRDKFMGTWYVQAGRFTALEKDPFNAKETYSWNEKKNQIDIDFSFNKGSLKGPVKEIPQTAWIENKNSNAYWKVRPFWPLKFDYLIIALDPDYQWTAIGVPNQAYLWIMSRKPQFSKEQVLEIITKLKRSGYKTEDIQYVQHSP